MSTPPRSGLRRRFRLPLRQKFGSCPGDSLDHPVARSSSASGGCLRPGASLVGTVVVSAPAASLVVGRPPFHLTDVILEDFP